MFNELDITTFNGITELVSPNKNACSSAVNFLANDKLGRLVSRDHIVSTGIGMPGFTVDGIFAFYHSKTNQQYYLATGISSGVRLFSIYPYYNGTIVNQWTTLNTTLSAHVLGISRGGVMLDTILQSNVVGHTYYNVTKGIGGVIHKQTTADDKTILYLFTNLADNDEGDNVVIYKNYFGVDATDINSSTEISFALINDIVKIYSDGMPALSLFISDGGGRSAIDWDNVGGISYISLEEVNNSLNRKYIGLSRLLPNIKAVSGISFSEGGTISASLVKVMITAVIDGYQEYLVATETFPAIDNKAIIANTGFLDLGSERVSRINTFVSIDDGNYFLVDSLNALGPLYIGADGYYRKDNSVITTTPLTPQVSANPTLEKLYSFVGEYDSEYTLVMNVQASGYTPGNDTAWTGIATLWFSDGTNGGIKTEVEIGRFLFTSNGSHTFRIWFKTGLTTAVGKTWYINLSMAYAFNISSITLYNSGSYAVNSLDKLIALPLITEEVGYMPTNDVMTGYTDIAISGNQVYYLNPIIGGKTYYNYIVGNHIGGSGAFMHDIATLSNFYYFANTNGDNCTAIESIWNADIIVFKSNSVYRLNPSNGVSYMIYSMDGSKINNIVKNNESIVFLGKKSVYELNSSGVIQDIASQIPHLISILENKSVISTDEGIVFIGDIILKYRGGNWFLDDYGSYLTNKVATAINNKIVLVGSTINTVGAVGERISLHYESIWFDSILFGENMPIHSGFYLRSIWVDAIMNDDVVTIKVVDQNNNILNSANINNGLTTLRLHSGSSCTKFKIIIDGTTEEKVIIRSLGILYKILPLGRYK